VLLLLLELLEVAATGVHWSQGHSDMVSTCLLLLLLVVVVLLLLLAHNQTQMLLSAVSCSRGC
jgi:hypothetical protein